MFSLSHILRKTVSKKNLSSPSYVGIISHTIEEIIAEKPLHSFIKHGTLYIQLQDHGKKMKLFQEKKIVLAKLQETLDKYGYKIKIQDIRFL